MATTMADVAKEGRDDDNVGAEDGDNNKEAEDTKGGERGKGGDPAVKYGNSDKDDDNKEDMMEIMGVLPLLVTRRVESLKYLNTERKRVMERYLEERAPPEMKYLDICKPLYEERGNIVYGCLDDKIESIHK